MTTVLRTERLLLRPLVLGDFDACREFLAEDRSGFVGGPVTDASRLWQIFASVAGHWALRGFGMFALEARATGDVLGACGPYFPPHWPEREMGWTLWSPAHQGQGFIHEAATAIRAHLYRALGWTTLVSYIDPANARSIAVARRLGCTLDAEAARPDPDLLVYRHPGPEALT